MTAKAPKTTIPAVKQQMKAAAEVLTVTAHATQQTAVASATTTYGPPGFVSPANWAAYDAAIKLAFANRLSDLGAAFGTFEFG